MKREYYAKRTVNKVEIYGTGVNLLGGLIWMYLGTVKFDKRLGEFRFSPSIFLLSQCKDLIKVIYNEMKYLEGLRC